MEGVSCCRVIGLSYIFSGSVGALKKCHNTSLTYSHAIKETDNERIKSRLKLQQIQIPL